MRKKKYKIRVNCIAFVDLVILAKNKSKAKELALKMASCDGGTDMEFVEFLEVDEWDEVKYEDD